MMVLMKKLAQSDEYSSKNIVTIISAADLMPDMIKKKRHCLQLNKI